MADLAERLKQALGSTYRIERELAGGGMSRVFLATEVRLSRQVVVKVLPPDMANAMQAERFTREIEVAASLQHPHIVPLLTAGSEGDLAWYIMPFVTGETLAAKITRQGALPIQDAVRILRDVVDALAFSHASGIVHRDIKPANVMFSGKHALVTDFGVAKALSALSGGEGGGLTSIGITIGTPTYMAPEQAAADPHVDHRADLYAVGVPSLEAQLRAAENRLAVLLGRTPGALAEELAEVRPIPTPPTTVAVGVPADIVRRRPDVRAAERALAAATARIGVAEGDLYPQLTIFGNVGTVADDASELFEASSSVLSVGPSIRWNLFDGGRVRRTIAAQDARAQQALARWEQLVLIALEEAENAMAAFVREQQRAEFLAEAAGQARRAVDFARTQYTEGLTDFQTVLDSERATSNLEDELAQSRAAIGTNLIALYKALGGGWESETE